MRDRTVMNGSIICLPLKKNVPSPKNKDWKLTVCSICGDECWESDLARSIMKKGVNAVCSRCAFRKGRYEK